MPYTNHYYDVEDSYAAGQYDGYHADSLGHRFMVNDQYHDGVKDGRRRIETCLEMPYANPDHRKAFEKARSRKRRALGLCKTCGSQSRPSKTRCHSCADKGH